MNSSKLTIVRDPGEPLGLFFRSGRDDHTVLKQLLSEGRTGMMGVVFDPCSCGIQEDLKAEILQRSLDAILDTGMMELAAAGTHNATRQRLPWAGPRPYVPTDFDSNKCDLVSEQIAHFVAEKRFSAVLAPTHYLHDGAKDPWFAIDKQLVLSLRQRLDSNGCDKIPIYYPLAIPMRLLVDSSSRVRIKASLANLPLDALWLRIHPFGSDRGDTSLRRYILACQELHTFGLPLIAEKTGVLGLALLAFGAVAGIDCGISSGEKFDFARLKRVIPPTKEFGRVARVYLSDLGGFLTRKQASEFFEIRGLRQFACRNTECCRHGHESMVKGSRRHFAYTRMVEVSQLSLVTPSLRPTEYLEEFLRPATDKIGRALAHAHLSDDLKQKLENSRSKLDGWRATLGQMARSRVTSFSPVFERRVRRERATA